MGKTRKKKPKRKTKLKRHTSKNSSATSPFKGFEEAQTLDDSPEDKDELFDKLLADGIKNHFNKNIKTYYNKKKEQCLCSSNILAFDDCRNRDSIIKWLNDNQNAFERATQTQTQVLTQDNSSQFDLPSVSQQSPTKHETRSRTKNRYFLRARSLDIQVKKNVNSGRNKRHSSAGDSPDFGNYKIEEVQTDEEEPISAQKEDEFLDNVEKEILQTKLSDWERVENFNKSIKCKKPKQLKIKVEESPKKLNRTYDYDELENYFIENMQKLIDVEKVDCVETFTIKDTLQVGRNFLTMLKKIKKKENMNEFFHLLEEIRNVLGCSVQKSDQSIQVVPACKSFQSQTVFNLKNIGIQSDFKDNKVNKFVQTVGVKLDVAIQTVNAKVDVAVQFEQVQQEEDVFDDDFNFDFNSEEFLKVKEKKTTLSSDLVVSDSSENKSLKRSRTESPEAVVKSSKRPCSDFINDNLSIEFSTCKEFDDNKNEIKEKSSQEKLDELENLINGNKHDLVDKDREKKINSNEIDLSANSLFETVIEDKTFVEESGKVQVLQNVVLKKSNFCEDDVIESTPQEPFQTREESQLDITLPPPVEFQAIRRPLAPINKITSTPVSQKPESEHCLTLSPISLSSKISSKKPIDKNRYSPLTINRTTPSKQKSILNYVRASQDNNFSPSKACIACSLLKKEEILAIASLTNKKLATFSSNFTSKVTHLIVSVNEKNCLKDHTIKFIMGVASGIWVLRFEWIEECLKKNQLVDEEAYEVLDVTGTPGPRNSRLYRLSKPLLKGFTIYPAPPFVLTTQQEIENVIRLLGGKVAPSPEYLLDQSNDICVVVTEARATQDFELYETWLDALKVVTVDLEWLSRSIGQYQLLSLRPFTLCSDDNIESLGYPVDLIANMTYSFSQQTFTSI